MSETHGMHSITVLVENKPGVLARVCGLFARRGFNIESLTVSITDDPTISRMTIVVADDEHELAQIISQTNKLIDVVKVVDYYSRPTAERELALIKVAVKAADRAELMQVANIFRANIIDISKTTFTIEVTGSKSKIDAFVELLKPYGIKEAVRTGTIVVSRGASTAMN
ncbi:MAG: acetolactate synthase small subunit [Abditibacteriota bacterium]|nr:acetolactate synthase small subunit [Abditibacteriota bacterium]